MAGQENCVRITRAARKRAADAVTVEYQSTKKKRVVFGELPNLRNVNVLVDSNSVPEQQKPKHKVKTKTRSTTKGGDLKFDNDATSDSQQMCGPYKPDIYGYLRQMETECKRRPLPNYIEKVQKDVTANMRGILVDWLVEVAEEYKLGSDTLFLCISYVDRFLSSNILNRQRLQLLGVSSMLIASKYEEITPPNVADFCYITDNTYSKQEVVKMEADVLKSLNFEMGNPTVKTFLSKFIDVPQESRKTENMQLECLSHYIAELSLLDYNCLKFLPSLVAASVMFVANFIIHPKKHPWSQTLQKCFGYKPTELKDCVLILLDLYQSRRGGSLHAVREKYLQHKFKRVATLAMPQEIPPLYFEDFY